MVSLKSGPDGKRRRKKVSGRNKTEVRAKLAELHDDLNDEVVSDVGYTVAQAIRDYQPAIDRPLMPHPSIPRRTNGAVADLARSTATTGLDLGAVGEHTVSEVLGQHHAA